MNSFSESIVRKIIQSFPEWEKYIRYENEEDGSEYLVVEVPAPSKAETELGLRIITKDNEITVDFDCYHCHFDEWPSNNCDRNSSALLFIEELKSEKFAVVSWWHENICRISAQFEPNESLESPFKIKYNRVRVRSWNGSLNQQKET